MKWLKTPIGIGVGTTILGFALTVCYDFLKDKPVLTTIMNALKIIENFLNLELKIWWILLGILVLVLILIVVSSCDMFTADWFAYTKDEIMGWKWEWEWEKCSNGMYGATDLHPICPICETPLCSEDNGHTICPRCRHTVSSKAPDYSIVESMIKDNIKKGLFPKE